MIGPRLAERLVRWRYEWLSGRREPLWFPLVLLGFFVLITAILRHPTIRFDLARAYLSFFVPLTSGVLAAYSILEDPARELRFSTPLRSSRLLAARLGSILAIQAICVAIYEALALAMRVDFSPLGGFWAVQAAWFVPTLALVSLGCAASLAAAQSALGAFAVGSVWLVQLLMKSWFVANAKPLYLFLHALGPHDPALAVNQATLLGLGVFGLFLSGWLLRRPERFL